MRSARPSSVALNCNAILCALTNSRFARFEGLDKPIPAHSVFTTRYLSTSPATSAGRSVMLPKVPAREAT
ncbi:MAG: hypothetical protein JWQ74_3604 [Marmoricola sp.]|nr:hypothetical protein [Marmoricola sp.]